MTNILTEKILKKKTKIVPITASLFTNEHHKNRNFTLQ